MEKYTIIDAHVHIFPSRIAAKANENVSKFYDLPMECEAGDVCHLLECAKDAGVTGCLVCSPATTPSQTRSINKFISSIKKKSERFISFGSIHPKSKNLSDDVEMLKSFGLEGIKLHPDFQNFEINSPEAFRLYEICHKLDIPILMHMGDARYSGSSPKQLLDVLKQIPDLKIIAAHLGGYQRWNESISYLKGDFKYLRFDTSSSLRFLGKRRARDLIEYFGIDKCFFGTDFPMATQKTELKEFLSLGFSEDQNRAILGENIISYLHLNRKRFLSWA